MKRKNAPPQPVVDRNQEDETPVASAKRNRWVYAQIKLHQTQHDRLTEAMASRGIQTIQQAVAQAIAEWIDQKQSYGLWASLAADEQILLTAVLHYIREDRGILMASLNALAHRLTVRSVIDGQDGSRRLLQQKILRTPQDGSGGTGGGFVSRGKD